MGDKNSDSFGNFSSALYNLTLEEEARIGCIIESSINVHRNEDVTYCEPIFDGLHCWFATPVNTIVNKTCPLPEGTVAPEGIYAFQYCQLDRQWENATNYNMCIDYIDSLGGADKDKVLAMVLRDIYFVCSIVSLILLIITLFIFSYFRSLQCSRISIHKNLVSAFIFRFVMIIVMIEPYVTGRGDTGSYRSFDWLCKIVLTLSQYPLVAIIFWMFVEGLFLHNRIVVSVFSTESPLKLFVFIGWGLPAVIVLAWVLTMTFFDQNYCWDNHSQSPFMYIIIAPFLAALIINLVFLINIIRVLVTKLKTNNSEAAQIKKAIKATVILMPLLGLTNLLFLWNPEDGGTLQIAYHVTNAVLHSTQGIFVSILYCFLNGEVRRVIKRKWDRFILRRFPRASGRRRSSRTSSFILSQTEVTTDPDSQHSRYDHIPMTNSNHSNHNTQSKLPKVCQPLMMNGRQNGRIPNEQGGYNSDDSDLSNQIKFTLKDIDDVLKGYHSDISDENSDEKTSNVDLNHRDTKL